MKLLNFIFIPLFLGTAACSSSPAATDTTSDTTGIDDATDDEASIDDSATNDATETTETGDTEATGETTETTDDAATAVDSDGDGYASDLDCDDASASINPGAGEDCGNGLDDDCDGTTDNPSSYYVDGDGDGYGDSAATAVTACSALTGYVTNNTDCKDNSATIYPGATEACNGSDDNCDGSIDESGSSSTYYADVDGDGFGSGAAVSFTCQSTAPAGYAALSTDCDDTLADVYPSAPEDCGNSRDDDCDGTLDNPSSYYVDADGDGYGSTTGSATVSCTVLAGYATNNTDCKDSIATTYPGATESCNGRDDDCDGTVDEGVKTTYYADFDRDTYGNSSSSQDRCAPSAFFSVTISGDCNDSSSTINPSANETCNSVDDDCNGSVDDNPDVGGTSWYADADADGWGSSTATAIVACTSPTADYSTDHTDCDDNNSAVSPTAPEVCDSIDNNCNGTVDDATSSTYYADADGDGFGDVNTTQTATCSIPTGYIADATDCDDDNNEVGDDSSCLNLSAVEEIGSTPCPTNVEDIVFTDASTGWIACSGSSVHDSLYATTDGGATWNKVLKDSLNTDMDQFHVYDIFEDTDGSVYFCGENNENALKHYVYKYSGGAYSTFANKTTTGGAFPCHAFSKIGTKVLYASNSSMVYSNNSGVAWASKTRWADAAVNHAVYAFAQNADDFYAMGYSTSGYTGPSSGGASPYVYSPSVTANAYDMSEDLLDGDMRFASLGGTIVAVDNGSGGTRFLVTGKDSDILDEAVNPDIDSDVYNDYVASGYVYYSDDLVNWTKATDFNTTLKSEVLADADSSNDYLGDFYGIDDFRGMACEDQLCIAVGLKFSTSGNGFIVYSQDAGATWHELEHEVIKSTTTKPSNFDYYFNDENFYAITIVDGQFWIAGESTVYTGTIEN